MRRRSGKEEPARYSRPFPLIGPLIGDNAVLRLRRHLKTVPFPQWHAGQTITAERLNARNMTLVE